MLQRSQESWGVQATVVGAGDASWKPHRHPRIPSKLLTGSSLSYPIHNQPREVFSFHHLSNKEAETEVSHLLVHSPKSPQRPRGQKPEAWNSSWVSPMGGRTESFHYCCLRWSALARNWNWKQSRKLKLGAPMWDRSISTTRLNAHPLELLLPPIPMN